MGRPTITVDTTGETIAYASRVDDDMPHSATGRASCPNTKPLK